jgi:hypothetical protein
MKERTVFEQAIIMQALRVLAESCNAANVSVNNQVEFIASEESAGISVMLATQRPGDLDYKCRENVRNWWASSKRRERSRN